jgi:DNA polymerase-3 subunit epsilon
MTDFNIIREWYAEGDFVVLDTETTGLTNAQIVDIAIIDSDGAVLLNELVQPTAAIPTAATLIHGITDDMVSASLCWPEVREVVWRIIRNKNIIAYNAMFDLRMLSTSDRHCHIWRDQTWPDAANWSCAMHAFAEFYGDWNRYRNSYTWKSLDFATTYLKIETSGHHRALLDATATLAVVQALFKNA